MLHLTESCDFGLDRWQANGEVYVQDGAGVRQGKAFVFNPSSGPLVNQITRQFRPMDSSDEQRSFRLSFWIKIEGVVAKDSPFISLSSSKEFCGMMFGISTNGKLYAGKSYEVDQMGPVYAVGSPAQPTLADGKYHYVEIYARYDADWSARVVIAIDNQICLNQTGTTQYEAYCWSRPDRIAIGNLQGTKFKIDDIILWDDTGTDYVNYKGSTILTSAVLPQHQNVLRGYGDISFPMSNKNAIASMVTMRVYGEEAASANIRPVITYDQEAEYGSYRELTNATEVDLSVFVKGGIKNTSIGIERQDDES